MLADRPSLAAADAYTAAATASVAVLRRLLSEDSGRASRAGGPRRWPPMLYLCYSRVTEELPGADAIGAREVAGAIGTVPHEILCRIGARIERTYNP